MTEEEHTEQKTFHDDLAGKALKHEKVIDARIDARLDKIKALAGLGRLGGQCLWLSA